MHFVRGEIGGRRLRQSGGINRLAIGQPPRAIARFAGRLQPLHQRDLAVERGIDLAFDNRRRALRPIARYALLGGPSNNRANQRILRRGHFAQLAHLAQRQVDRPRRCQEPARCLLALAERIIVDHRIDQSEPRQIGFGIGGGRDAMFGVEEVGQLEIGPALLEDGVGALDRINPEFCRRDIPGFDLVGDDIAIELGRIAQAGGRDGADRREVAPRPRQIFRPGHRHGANVELRFQMRVGTLVEPQPARQLGRTPHLVLEDLLEQRIDPGVATGRACHRFGQCRRWRSQ